MLKKKIISITLTAAMVTGLAVIPAHAEAEAGIAVSAPRYYLVTKDAETDGYDAFEEMDAPVDGVFKDIVTWGKDDNYGPITGKFRSEVDFADGSGKDATMYGAVYDANGKIVSVDLDSKATADGSGSLSVTSDVGSGETYKTLVWNDNLEPLELDAKAPVICYFYCDDPNTVTIAWYNDGGSYTLYKNGAQVDISGLAPSGGNYSVMGKRNVYIYTDTSAATGDKYVVKNGDVPSEELTADFADGAYITMGRYVSGRNMAYLRNDNAAWYHDSVSRHMNINGTECDAAVYKTFEANSKTYQKWTSFYFKLDQDYISGSGNTVDITVDYFDYGTEPLRLYYYPDPSSSNMSAVEIAQLEDTKTWKTVTYRLSSAAFAADTGVDGDYQFRFMTSTGSAISNVSVAPCIDTTITNVRAANTYTDGVELRWTTASAAGITGYTIKRNGTTIAQNYQKRVYYDRNLTADTAYTYTVTAETAQGPGAESSEFTTRTQPNTCMTMTLPFNSGYEDATASSSSEAGTDSEGVDYTENGLTFRFCNNNRWRRSTTVARKRGGKYCRATVMRNTQGSMTRPALADFYDWNTPSSNRQSSQMLFKVDNSIISTSQRDITIEFDYFGDTNSDQSSIELKYLKYNNGGTPSVSTKWVSMTKDNAWHTAKVDITDAQFDKSAADSNNLNDGAGRYYDFQIGMGGNRGGFAMTNVKVYIPGCIPMPDHEVSAEVNSAGTAFEGALLSSIWNGSYDRNIGFSGTDGMPAADGKQYAYNREFTEYGNETWKQWANNFCFKIPDDVLYGSDYTRVEIDVEYYAPTSETTMKLLAKNSSNNEISVENVSAATGVWTTKTFVITSTDGKNIVFNNGSDGSVDIRITFDKQAYIHKVAIRKDMLED